jgi:hypothetical protein
MTEGARGEMKRLKRVADQMATAHALLESRFVRRSVALDVGLMVASFCLLMLSIVSLFKDAVIGIPLAPLAVLGSALIFVIAVAEWRVQWKDRSSKHGDARKEYSSIKLELSSALTDSEFPNPGECERMAARYEAVGARVIPIPDQEFLRLKQSHLRKVYISRLLDRYPFAPRWLIRIKAHYQHLRKVIGHEHT